MFERIRERLAVITPWPWKNDCGNGQVETADLRVTICERAGNYQRKEEAIGMYGNDKEFQPDGLKELLDYDNEDDMEFIAAAPTDISMLLKALDLVIDGLSCTEPFRKPNLLERCGRCDFCLVLAKISELEKGCGGWSNET